MKLLFISESRHLYQEHDAVQLNTHELALKLVSRGHSPVVAAELKTTDLLGLKSRVMGKFTSKRQMHDTFLGYPTYRRWNVMEALPELLDEIRPDVVITQPRNHILLALELARLGVPRVVYFHDAHPSMFHGRQGNPGDVREMACLSNSKDTAQKLLREFGVETTILRPIIRAEDFKKFSSDSSKKAINVTVIDPQVQNGVYLPIKLASSCPEIPICFLSSHYLPKDQKRVLKDCARMYPNLSVQKPTRQMGKVFGRAKIFLVPGDWDSNKDHLAWQAHCGGIPVVASNLGTQPEALGPGDILLDPDGPIESWIHAVKELWNDTGCYVKASEAVLAQTKRAEINPINQIDCLLEVAAKAIKQQSDSRHSAA